MSRLDELIREYCPDGVEYKKLNEVSIMQRGTTLTKAKAITGDIPVISGGKEPAFYCNYPNRDGDVVTVAGSGASAGYVQYWKIPIFANDCFTIKGNNNTNTKYLYYCMTNSQDKIYETKKGGGVPHVHISDIENHVFPVPPLPVQKEIVRILDSFTELTAELQAELQARKKQYGFYIDELLTSDKNVRKVKLGDISEIVRGGNFQKKDFIKDGKACIHYGQIYTHYGMSATNTLTTINEIAYRESKKASTNDIVMAVTSENIEDVCKAVAWLGNDEIAVSGHTAIIKHHQNAEYLSYYFMTNDFFNQKKKLAHGTKVIEVTPSKLSDIVIPLPSIDTQNKIVKILNNFNSLCTNLTSGLPAEIEARQKQYEYYRDKLLTFKRLGGDE